MKLFKIIEVALRELFLVPIVVLGNICLEAFNITWETVETEWINWQGQVRRIWREK